MKSFVLTIPKSISQIENHYFCKCGEKFVNKNKCPKCGNAKFFIYEDVKKYNPKLYEIQESKNGLEVVMEYPVFRDNEILTKKDRIAILIDNEVKLNKLFRENFLLYYDEISEVIKIYLKYLGLWRSRKKYFYLLKEAEDKRILFLITAKDPEILLWESYDLVSTKEEIFNRLLKNSPKSVKKAIFEKYKKQVFKFRYEPLLDYLIINAIDDVNFQRELIKYVEDKYVSINANLGVIDNFIHFLKQFDKREVLKFLKNNIEAIDMYIDFVNKHEIKEIRKNIEETFEKSINKPIVYKYDIKEIYHFKDLTFKLPFNSEELIYWSDKLKNCLSSYTNIHNKRYLIFGVFKKNKLTYALNFDKEKKYIVEAKGFANSLVPDEDMIKIEEFIKELKI